MSELPIAPPTVLLTEPPPRLSGLAELPTEPRSGLAEVPSGEPGAAGRTRAEALPPPLPARFPERLGDQAVHVAERLRYLAPPS
ncbi:MAG TPA: hypothetical protein VIL48_11880 [Acidimicrobiales bacterium]